MRRGAMLAGCVGAVLAASPASGQYRDAHSATYLFGVEVHDARALWVNPAGLAVLPEASIMGEFVVDRLVDGGLGLGQYGAGFSSHGLGFGFRHDRLSDTLSTNTFRFGAARAFRGFAVGLAGTIHTNASLDSRRAFDLGVRLSVTRAVELGITVHHIGRPEVIDSTLTTAVTAGLGWAPLSMVRLTAEVRSADRTVGSGVVNTWRGGVQIGFPGPVPVGAFGMFTLNDDFEPARLTIGLSAGGTRRGILVGSERLRDGSVRAESLGLTGVAINVLGAERRAGQSTSLRGITRQR